jgi:hypothetical protein
MILWHICSKQELRNGVFYEEYPHDRAEFTGHSHGNVVLAVCV